MTATTQYIGITDFENRDQVDLMKRLLDGTGIALHVGVMSSYKTVNGIESSWTDVFPPLEELSEIFGNEDAYNVAHHADFDNVKVRSSLTKLLGHTGLHLKGLQLDMIWPDPESIWDAIVAQDYNIDVILQINSKSMHLCNNDPQQVVERLKLYPFVTHVLLDKSMGQGQGMDSAELLKYADAIRADGELDHIQLAFAGGLGPETYYLAKPIIERYPDASFDAQGRLRPSGSARDPVDWEYAAQYVTRMRDIILQAQS